MTREGLIAAMQRLNRRFETPGDDIYDDKEALHSAMDALLLEFAGPEVELEFDKHGKWYA